MEEYKVLRHSAEQIDKLLDEVPLIAKGINEFQSIIGGFDPGDDDIYTSIQTLNSNINNLKETLEETVNSIDSMNVSIEQLSISISHIQESLNDIDNRVMDIESKIES